MQLKKVKILINTYFINKKMKNNGETITKTFVYRFL